MIYHRSWKKKKKNSQFKLLFPLKSNKSREETHQHANKAKCLWYRVTFGTSALSSCGKMNLSQWHFSLIKRDDSPLNTFFLSFYILLHMFKSISKEDSLELMCFFFCFGGKLSYRRSRSFHSWLVELMAERFPQRASWTQDGTVPINMTRTVTVEG